MSVHDAPILRCVIRRYEVKLSCYPNIIKSNLTVIRKFILVCGCWAKDCDRFFSKRNEKRTPMFLNITWPHSCQVQFWCVSKTRPVKDKTANTNLTKRAQILFSITLDKHWAFVGGFFASQRPRITRNEDISSFTYRASALNILSAVEN